MRSLELKNLRPLNIKFDLYAESEDNEFKSELVVLMKGSIAELRDCAVQAFQLGDADLFSKACHKAKSTLVLLSDNDLNMAVDRLKLHLGQIQSKIQTQESCILESLNTICQEIEDSLAHEAHLLRN